MSHLPLFSKTLFYMRDNHPVEVAPRARQLLVGALEGVALQEREVVITRDPGQPPRWVTVTINGQHCEVNIARVDAPWALRSELQNALQFVQGHLAPAAPDVDPTERLVAIEVAATNGMLTALDGRSALLDVETYRTLRARLPRGQNTARADGGGTRSQEASDASAAASAGPSVVSRLTAPGSAVGYIRLETFGPGASAELKRALARFEAERVKGLLLDLRDNPGGLLDEAVAVADAFIKDGTLGSMVSKERGTHQRKAFVARNDGYEPAGALVVLVNHRSAAASEFVAAAIKNLGRGVILGEPTAGSASIRVVFDIAKGPPALVQPDTNEPLGLFLATGRLRASGDSEIEAVGVMPDIQPTCVTGARSRSDDDCLVQLAENLVARARDPRRSTLLAVAKEIGTPAVPPPSTPR